MSLGRAEPLPGDYKVGEKVFYMWSNQTFANGDKVVHGQQGEVTGPATRRDGKEGVAVLFPGNTGNVDCLLHQVRRPASAPPPLLPPRLRPRASLPPQVSHDPPPPLPGGYKMGDKVFFTGASQTDSNGDKLVNGQQGELVGPAEWCARGTEWCAVLFPGNKGNINCLLTSVRRLRAAPACPPPRPPCAGAGPGLSSPAP